MNIGRFFFLGLIPGMLLSIILSVEAALSVSDFKTPYAGSLPAGSNCTVALTALHPTQAVVGMKEVEHKKEKIDGKSPAKLEEYMLDHVVPIVVGPDGVPYMTDHHHTCLALLESGRVSFAYAKIIDNWSDLTPSAFWSKMEAEHYCWLEDAAGKPITPKQLPTKITGMTDDPWRAVVWKLEHLGVIEKQPIYFFEFHWADTLEKNIKVNPNQDFDGAVAASQKFIESHPSVAPVPNSR